MKIEAKFNGQDMQIELYPTEPGEEKFLGLFSRVNAVETRLHSRGAFDYMDEDPTRLTLTLKYEKPKDEEAAGEKV